MPLGPGIAGYPTCFLRLHILIFINMKNEKLLQLARRFEENKAVCSRVIQTTGILSTKIRFRIACALSETELSVTDLMFVIGKCKQSNVSLQLKQMTKAGIIKCRREGKSMIYSYADPKLRQLIRFLQKIYGTGAE